MLSHELFRNTTLVGPDHSVQIPQVKPRKPQLDRGQANIRQNHLEGPRVRLGAQRQAVGGCVVNAMTDTGQPQQFQGLLDVAMFRLHSDMTVYKPAA